MPFDFQPVLKGKLLELRPLRAEDFDDLFLVAADPSFGSNIRRRIATSKTISGASSVKPWSVAAH